MRNLVSRWCLLALLIVPLATSTAWAQTFTGGVRGVVTDSGGVQEETSAVGTPCLTYRTTTERPITCELGTNELVGTDPAALAAAIERVLSEGVPDEAPEIPLWDGAAGPRAAEAIGTFLGQRKSA